MCRLSNIFYAVFFVLTICSVSCRQKTSLKNNDLVADPVQMNEKVKANIEFILSEVEGDKKIIDSTQIVYYYPILQSYGNNNYNSFWCNTEKLTSNANLLIRFVDSCAKVGLFKEDYHFKKLTQLKYVLDTDSVKRMDAVMWAHADIILSEVFAALLKDLKQGRLVVDSASYRNDTTKYRTFFDINFGKIRNGEDVISVLTSVQPKHNGYEKLKLALDKFIDSMDLKDYTFLNYPYKDSLSFIKLFKKRITEEGFTVGNNVDSIELKDVVKKYQVSKGLVVDGKIGKSVVKRLNLNDRQKFTIIAITLDKYKLLPEKMPQKYVFVNLPAYNLKVWSADTIAVNSKIICGKSTTPTPHITSVINNIVLYPTWTVPMSIIKKELLPGLKRNTDYLTKKGLYLLDTKGEKVDPAVVNWAKYTKGIPFRIQQGSGDGNALGVIKFNFENPYSVYLHDTNQRYLFKNSIRSLSHGCVRVQDWQQLANFIVRNDSANWNEQVPMNYNTDSIRLWIARKQKQSVSFKNKIPLFIRYFTCESVNGTIKFYDDIYGEDKALKAQFFAAN